MCVADLDYFGLILALITADIGPENKTLATLLQHSKFSENFK